MTTKIDKKIRVMHILPNLEIGGMENGVVNIANGIDKDKFELSICCLSGIGPLRERLGKDTKVIDMQQGPGKAWHLSLKLGKLFGQERVDIVHTHNSFAGVYGIMGAKFHKHCVVLHGEHGIIDYTQGYRKKIKALFCSLSDKITTVSKGLKEDVNTIWGVPLEKIIVILNGVDREKFKKREVMSILAGDRILSKTENDVILGTVGRLSDQKNYPFLLAAMQEIFMRRRNTKLLFVGEGPLRSELETVADRLSIKDKVYFLGERKDVSSILNIMDIFLFPAYKGEGLANCLLEAMSVGLPVVASDIKGNIEVVEDNRTGFLFPSNDRECFIERVLTLIENSELRMDFGSAGMDRVHRVFSIERMIKDYETLYLDVIKKQQDGNNKT